MSTQTQTQTPQTTTTTATSSTSTSTPISPQSSQSPPTSDDSNTITWEHVEHAPSAPQPTDDSIEERISRLPGRDIHVRSTAHPQSSHDSIEERIARLPGRDIHVRDTATGTAAVDIGMQAQSYYGDVPVSGNVPAIRTFPPSPPSGYGEGERGREDGGVSGGCRTS
ncbi:hypothetical protein BO78DRAFT_85346 [Aspergillus sclerotiicarbonarius CBS 121057]|uniref:Uncharacterized protein n=1 Tax=Aspergillus sclerotiicarbonarius (strain CBS 121057 / IBT 28362) TaxID=1448318 RepID=A0A319EZB0_ASPSB|nr:hypothetical protein BO78DRAFT_85346 [Aspergillus sclerotiicarbonarius CBS 121057]